jgi:hypothetical protein
VTAHRLEQPVDDRQRDFHAVLLSLVLGHQEIADQCTPRSLVNTAHFDDPDVLVASPFACHERVCVVTREHFTNISACHRFSSFVTVRMEDPRIVQCVGHERRHPVVFGVQPVHYRTHRSESNTRLFLPLSISFRAISYHENGITRLFY